MRTIAALTLLLSGTALAAPPTLIAVKKSTVHVGVPEGWTHHISLEEDNAVMNKDAATSVTVSWYGKREGRTTTTMADALITKLAKKVPMGKVEERTRETVLDGRGLRVDTEYQVFGYALRLTVVAVIDPRKPFDTAAVFVAPPEAFEALEGAALSVQIADSLQMYKEP